MLKLLSRLLQLVLFVVLLLFALRNTDTVALRFFFGWEWQAPLVLVLLVFFAVGSLFGLLACLPVLFGQRREVTRLRKQIQEFEAVKSRMNGSNTVQRLSQGEMPPAVLPVDHVA